MTEPDRTAAGLAALDEVALRDVPPTPVLQFAYEALVLLAPDIDHGRTPLGQRLHVPIIGGHFHGPRLRGEVLPGGADWQRVRADGYLELEALYDMCCDDGTLIHVRNRGLFISDDGDWPARYAMSQPQFDVPIGAHDWLNRHCFVATVAPDATQRAAIRLHVFQVGMPDGPGHRSS